MNEPSRLRRFFRLHTPAEIASDVSEEVGFHLDMRIAELIREGMSPEAARAEALRAFGDVDRTSAALRSIDRARLHDERRADWLATLRQELRHALRGMRREPGFSAVVMLTVAIGVGANTMMFGIMDRVLFRGPAHVVDPDRIREVFHARISEGAESIDDRIGYPQFASFREHVHGFDGAAAIFSTNFGVGTGADARPRPITLATSTFWSLTGVRPAIGRFYTAAEDRGPVGEHVAVLSHGMWQRDFGGRADALGRSLVINGESYVIVGVAPRGFTGIDLAPVDAWVPLSAAATGLIGAGWQENHSVGWIRAAVRLGANTTSERLNEELTAALRIGWDTTSVAESRPRAFGGSIIAGRGPSPTGSIRVARWVSGVAVVVLAIACANVATLLLVRATRRRREIAVRLSLGISRGRLFAQVLIETLVLAMSGAAIGLGLAEWGGRALRTVLLPGVAWSSSPFDGRILAFTTAVTVGCALIAGLFPALQAAPADLAGALKSGVREGTAPKSALRSGLLVTQAALSAALLVGAGLFLRSFANVRTADMGFDPAALVVDMDLSAAGYDGDARLAMWENLRDRIAALPGIEEAALGSGVPFFAWIRTAVAPEGADSARSAFVHSITPTWFATMGTRIVRGRPFSDTDRAATPRVTVVSEAMAQTFWPGQEALGKCLKVGGRDAPCSEVVGIALDLRIDDVRRAPTLQFYVPNAQRQWAARYRILVVRPRGDPLVAAAEIRRQVHGVLPRLPFTNVQPLSGLLADQTRPWRLGAMVFTVFGALALVVAAVGLYSVVAYTAANRTHEIGVRMSLGAQGRDILRLIIGQGLRVVSLGLTVGLALALAGGKALAPLLFEVSPRDPAVFTGVAIALLVTALAAGSVPAWRAARTEPRNALRQE